MGSPVVQSAGRTKGCGVRQNATALPAWPRRAGVSAAAGLLEERGDVLAVLLLVLALDLVAGGDPVVRELLQGHVVDDGDVDRGGALGVLERRDGGLAVLGDVELRDGAEHLLLGEGGGGGDEGEGDGEGDGGEQLLHGLCSCSGDGDGVG